MALARGIIATQSLSPDADPWETVQVLASALVHEASAREEAEAKLEAFYGVHVRERGGLWHIDDDEGPLFVTREAAIADLLDQCGYVP